MKNTVLSVAIATAMIAGQAHGAMVRNAGTGGNGTIGVRGTDVVLFDQNNSAAGNGVPDQDFETAFDAYDSFAADDFVVNSASGWTINTISTVGTTGTAGGATVDVVFYGNSAGGGDPDLPNTGSIECSYTGLTPTDTGGSFVINLPTSCILDQGTYWLELQTNQGFGTNGQHFWSNRSVQSGSESVWRNPGGGFATACTTYAPQTVCGVGGGASPDLLFALSGVIGGASVPMTSNPPSGPLALPAQSVGGAATTATITYTNTNATAGTVTCTQPAATQFTVNPAVINVPANGTAPTTVSFSSASAGAFTGTLNCTGSNAESFTYNLSGNATAPISSTPPSPGTINFGTITAGGTGGTSSITFTNPAAAAATVTCTAPTPGQFTADPLVLNLPANGSGITNLTFNSAGLGTFNGTFACAGSNGEAFTFALQGTAGSPTAVPALSDLGKLVALLSALGLGLWFVRRQTA